MLGERAFALAPLTTGAVDAMIDKTRLATLLAGVRGRPAADRAALLDLVLRFSALVIALRDDIAEIDLNPVIVAESGCCIVDALVIPAASE